MSEGLNRPAGVEADGVVDGDDELDLSELDRVSGGVGTLCGACSHTHASTDAKCNPQCQHGAPSSSPDGVIRLSPPKFTHY